MAMHSMPVHRMHRAHVITGPRASAATVAGCSARPADGDPQVRPDCCPGASWDTGQDWMNHASMCLLQATRLRPCAKQALRGMHTPRRKPGAAAGVAAARQSHMPWRRSTQRWQSARSSREESRTSSRSKAAPRERRCSSWRGTRCPAGRRFVQVCACPCCTYAASDTERFRIGNAACAHVQHRLLAIASQRHAHRCRAPLPRGQRRRRLARGAVAGGQRRCCVARARRWRRGSGRRAGP